jgi:uncharacterized protein
MSLKYNCSNCGVEIITKFLHPGDTLFCPACKVLIEVPSDTVDSDSDSSIRKTIKQLNLDDGANDILSPATAPKEALPPQPTPWGVVSVLKFIVAYFGAILLLSCIIGFILGLFWGFVAAGHKVKIGPNDEMFGEGYTRALGILISIFSTVVPVFMVYYSVVKRHHNNFCEALHIRKISRRELWRYIMIGGGFAAAILGATVIISLTPLKKLIPENLPITDYLKLGYPEAISFSFAALLAPFSEEMMFRGYFFQGLNSKFSVLTSAIVVSIAFTLMHGFQLSFSPIPLILIGALSVLLIYTRIKSDSLTNSILIHLIYNSVLTLLMWACILLFGFDSAMKM